MKEVNYPHPNTRRAILKKLESCYPNPESELDFKNEFQLLISVMLSAQCTDKKVNQVTPNLFRIHPNANSLAKASVEDIEEIIRTINYYKTKSKHLVATANLIIDNFNGDVPKTHKELTSLPGVGRKTANVVLSELGIEYRLAVDTHVFRVSKRLGLAHAKTRDKVEDELIELFKPEDWRTLHHSLILHGRAVCIARSPKCNECQIRKMCKNAGKY